MTLYIILIFISIFIIGFSTIWKRFADYCKMLEFANLYRVNFIQLSNKYFESYDRWNSQGIIDSELYIWLTKNVNRMQSDVGEQGRMHYVGPWQTYQVKNYQIIINTLPKFRHGTVENFDVSSTDDCLLRHSGVVEDLISQVKQKLKNPVIWFQEGFKQIISIPIYLLNWFGIINSTTTTRLVRNRVYSVFVGIGGIVTFISGLVTIVQGKKGALLLFDSIIKLLHIK